MLKADFELYKATLEETRDVLLANASLLIEITEDETIERKKAQELFESADIMNDWIEGLTEDRKADPEYLQDSLDSVQQQLNCANNLVNLQIESIRKLDDENHSQRAEIKRLKQKLGVDTDNEYGKYVGDHDTF